MKKSPDKSAFLAMALTAAVAIPTIGTAVYLDKSTGEEAMAVLDEDAKQALKIKKLFEEIEGLKGELEEIQGGVNTSATEVALNPGDVVLRIKNVRGVIKALALTVDEVADTGFRVNSGVVYGDVREIDGKLGKLRSNNWVKYGSKMPGKEYLPGKAGQAAQIINSLNGLERDLVKLRKSLDGIADVNIAEFSNNKYVNKEARRAPRDMFRQRMAAVDVVLAERPHTCDFGAEARMFLDEYGFAKWPENLDRNDDDYFEKLGEYSHKGFTKYIAVMKTAFKSKLAYEENGRRTSHPNVKKFQEMLSLGGYYDYNKIDGNYGKMTHAAFREFWEKDFGDDPIPEYLGIKDEE